MAAVSATTSLALVLVLAAGSLGNPVPAFPAVRHTESRAMRLKSARSENYVFLRVDGEDITFGTKPLTSPDDPEVEFTLNFFEAADAGNSILVLPTHEATHRFLQMSQDNTLEIAPMDNEVFEDANTMRRADARFFVFKRAVDHGSEAFVLEATNGKERGWYVAVDGEQLLLKELPNESSYPTDVVLYMDDTVINLIAP